jgi:lysylphosphatidylglycerol synthetase-like protein (DUF2156 family)
MYDLKDEASEFKKPEPLASIVKRLGNPESTTLLHSSCHVFQIPQVDGVIGYHQIGNCAVVVGDPICLPQDTAELTKAFHLYCQECDLKTVYLLAYHDFANWAINNGCRTLIQVGSELSIDPTKFQKKQKLRWKMNQSIQHGVHVEEYKNYDPSLEYQMKNTIHTWSKQRRGPQIHLGDIHLFNSDAEKRIFYAKQNDRIIGVLMLTPVDRFQGWVVSSYLAILEAPAGTTEHLICSTIDSLANENCHFLCLGAVSGTQLGEVIGLSPFGKTAADLIFKTARWFFKLDAKAIYLKKYHPHFRSTFLLSRGKLRIAELLAIKHVLNVKQ